MVPVVGETLSHCEAPLVTVADAVMFTPLGPDNVTLCGVTEVLPAGTVKVTEVGFTEYVLEPTVTDTGMLTGVPVCGVMLIVAL